MISIIGGSGFIGDKLSELFDFCKVPFVIVDIEKPYRFYHKYYQVDIRDLKSSEKVFSGCNQIINLAAKHQDNIRPVNLYYDVNVRGAEETVRIAEKFSIKKIVFVSSTAVYGLHITTASEETPLRPFGHYGKSKLQAEQVYNDWQRRTGNCLIIIRPTVVFGEGNRGNFHNLLIQLREGNFLMVGNGENKKSMAYVGNIAAFIKYCAEEIHQGLHIFNYSDGPDLTMNELVRVISQKLNKKILRMKIPYLLGLVVGYALDLLSYITKKEFLITSVRVKKFCANTHFSSDIVGKSGFKREFTLMEGLERTLLFEFGKEYSHRTLD